MTAKSLKSKVAAPGQRRVPALPVEDDERHTREVDDFVARNRDALNESITRSRKEVAGGKFSAKSIDDIVIEGRKRHSRSS